MSKQVPKSINWVRVHERIKEGELPCSIQEGELPCSIAVDIDCTGIRCADCVLDTPETVEAHRLSEVITGGGSHEDNYSW